MHTKDYWEIASWICASICASIGVVIALVQAFSEIRRSRELRAEELKERVEEREEKAKELRWRKAHLAKEILDTMMAKKAITDAMTMLDWDDRTFQISPLQTERISWEELKVSLRIGGAKFGHKEQYARDCFDDLFEAMENIEHYITTDLILFEDVKYPLEYIVKELYVKNRSKVVREYIEYFGYDLAARFIDRFSPWNEIKKNSESAQNKVGMSTASS